MRPFDLRSRDWLDSPDRKRAFNERLSNPRLRAAAWHLLRKAWDGTWGWLRRPGFPGLVECLLAVREGTP